MQRDLSRKRRRRKVRKPQRDKRRDHGKMVMHTSDCSCTLLEEEVMNFASEDGVDVDIAVRECCVDDCGLLADDAMRAWNKPLQMN
jgi:hypothetical protein